MDEHTREEQRFMMVSPNEWPVWPLLPLKRPNRDRGFPEIGLLVEVRMDEPIQPVVWMTDIFSFAGQDKSKIEKKEYLDFEGLLDDGWIVD